MFKRKKKEIVQPADPFVRILMQKFSDEKSSYRLVTVVDEGVRTFYDHTYVLILYSSVSNTATAVKVCRQYEEKIEEFVTEVSKCETLSDLKVLDEKDKIYYD